MPSITKLYRRLATSSVNLNWIAAGVYVYSALLMGGMLFISWVINAAQGNGFRFGRLTIDHGNNITMLIMAYCIGGLTCLALLAQVAASIIRQHRITNIDSFYGFQLVPQLEIEEIRKSRNKRNRVIFIVCLAITFFLFWLTYKIVKRRKLVK